jgi:hypothetical protein
MLGDMMHKKMLAIETERYIDDVVVTLVKIAGQLDGGSGMNLIAQRVGITATAGAGELPDQCGFDPGGASAARADAATER